MPVAVPTEPEGGTVKEATLVTTATRAVSTAAVLVVKIFRIRFCLFVRGLDLRTQFDGDDGSRPRRGVRNNQPAVQARSSSKRQGVPSSQSKRPGLLMELSAFECRPHRADPCTDKERDEVLQAALEVANAEMAALKKSLEPAQSTLERTT